MIPLLEAETQKSSERHSGRHAGLDEDNDQHPSQRGAVKVDGPRSEMHQDLGLILSMAPRAIEIYPQPRKSSLPIDDLGE